MNYNYLIDTHAHLYARQFDGDRAQVIARAKAAGVHYFFLPNIDIDSIEPMLKMERDFGDCIRPMMGLHPCSVDKNWEQDLERVRKELFARPFAAVGEIGLDYYWDMSHVEAQKEALRLQCAWAHELGLPVCIHVRNAQSPKIANCIDDALRFMETFPHAIRGVFHCFTGTREQAERALALGFYLGIGGVLTYPNGGINKIIHELPLEKLVLETDAPYLAPVPHRGKRNSSEYIPFIAQELATLRRCSLEEVTHMTTQAAWALFSAEKKPEIA